MTEPINAPLFTPEALSALAHAADAALDGATRARMEMALAASRLLAGPHPHELAGALSTLAAAGRSAPAPTGAEIRGLGALFVTHLLGMDRFAEVAGGIRDDLVRFVNSKDELVAAQRSNTESLAALNATLSDNNALLREQVNALLQQNEELRRRNAELERGDEWKAGADDQDPDDDA